jgi:DNA-binding winged helix-turn-helix (wHTH) protein
MSIRFGRFTADTERFELRRGGEVVPVQRRVLETILFLANSGGRLVTREDLLKGPWQGALVSDAALKHAIMHARRALFDAEQPHSFIVTVRGKGYRFSAPGERHDAPPAASGTGLWHAAQGQSRRERPREAGSTRPERLAVSRSALKLAQSYGDPLHELHAQLAHAQHLLEQGFGLELTRLVAEHASLAARVRHPAHLWFSVLLSWASLFREGRARSAARVLLRSLPFGRRFVGPSANSIAATHALNLALELTGGARYKLLRTAEALALRGAGPSLPSKLVASVARLHLADAGGARRLAGSVFGELDALPRDRDYLPVLVNLIDLAVAFDERDGLGAVQARLFPYAGQRVGRDFADWGPVTYHLGRAARALGDVAESRRLFQLAARESRGACTRSWELWAGFAWGRTLLKGATVGEQRRGRAVMARALSAARELGLPALSGLAA